MGIHMNLDHHEPPNGDFVAVIDRMVGAPPDDPETAARAQSAILEARGRALKARLESDDPNHEHANDHDGPPDLADALSELRGGVVRGFTSGISRLLIIGGAAVLFLTGFMEMPLPVVEPVHGIIALIAGVILNNSTS